MKQFFISWFILLNLFRNISNEVFYTHVAIFDNLKYLFLIY